MDTQFQVPKCEILLKTKGLKANVTVYKNC